MPASLTLSLALACLPPDAAETAKRIDAYVAPYVAAGHLSGHLLVAKGDEVIYERSFGFANREHGVAIGPETRFNVASISKPMTVIAFIKLAEQQKIAMTDKLAKWIPGFPNGDAITVEHLLRHRSGIPHRVTEAFEETVPRTATEMVEIAKRKPLLFAPGERYSYSSGGFAVLARVLELASGESYGDLVRRLVFEPAGITHTCHADSRTIVPARAESYQFDRRGEVVHTPLQDLSFLVGAGSVWSTARDLHALSRAVRSGKFGEGARLSSVRETGIEWNGMTGGFRAFADWHKASDVTVILTANIVTGAADRIRRDVAAIAAGENATATTPPSVAYMDVSPERLRSYEGVYLLRGETRLDAHVEEGGLRVGTRSLWPIGERSFFCMEDYATVEVVFEAGSERPTRIDWKLQTETLPCPRVGDR